MESKQTAVESMYLIMFEKQGRISREEFDIIMDKQKQQIINAHISGFTSKGQFTSEEYYNQTFKP